MNLKDAREGQLIVYLPWPNAPSDQWEYGVITGKNHRYVFVRYTNDHVSKATHPHSIRLMKDAVTECVDEKIQDSVGSN